MILINFLFISVNCNYLYSNVTFINKFVNSHGNYKGGDSFFEIIIHDSYDNIRENYLNEFYNNISTYSVFDKKVDFDKYIKTNFNLTSENDILLINKVDISMALNESFIGLTLKRIFFSTFKRFEVDLWFFFLKKLFFRY